MRKASRAARSMTSLGCGRLFGHSRYVGDHQIGWNSAGFTSSSSVAAR